MDATFQPGDRVEMTEIGTSTGLHGRSDLPCRGTVRRVAYSGQVVVVRDGFRSEEYYDPVFWRLAAREEAPDAD